METKILKPTKENILKAVEILKQGEVLAVPTETVYGLVADVFCDKAVDTDNPISLSVQFCPRACNPQV